MDGAQGSDPKQVLMSLIQVLGIELVTKILTDDQFSQQIAALVEVAKQMQPEEKQALVQQIQQMSGGQGAEQPQQEQQSQGNAFY